MRTPAGKDLLGMHRPEEHRGRVDEGAGLATGHHTVARLVVGARLYQAQVVIEGEDLGGRQCGGYI